MDRGLIIKECMETICQKYKFSKFSKNEFRYCDREVKKDENGVHVICPNLMDRIKLIFLSIDQKIKDIRGPNMGKENLKNIINNLA